MSADNLIISKADITDAAMLTLLSIITFVETFAAGNRKEDMDKYIAEEMNEAKITEELKDKSNLFFLARYNEKLVGYAKMRTLKKPVELSSNRPIELERIYVLKEYQGTKTGVALMNVCLTYALNHKYDTIWLGVWEHNHKAVNFYKRYGFELFGSHPFKLGDDIQRDLLLKKKLVTPLQTS